MLDKAIATLGSVGVELYPDFNVFEVARPYARDLLFDRFKPRRVAGRASNEVRDYARLGRELPFQLHDVLEEVRDGQLEIGIKYKELDELLHRSDILVNRTVVALLCAAGVIGSAILAGAEAGPAGGRLSRPGAGRLRHRLPRGSVGRLGGRPLRPGVDSLSRFFVKGHLETAGGRW